MKSTSSALTPRKIAEFCKSRFTTISTESEVRLLYGCLVDLLERAEYPPYRGSGLDLQASYAIQDTPDMVAQHYGRFLPQDKSEIAARILNQVWEAA